MQGNTSNADNFGSQECKQKEKIDSDHSNYKAKNMVKSNGLAGGFRDGAIPSVV